MRLSHKPPEEAGRLESRRAISSSALASSNRSSNGASKGATNRLLELSIGEHRSDHAVNYSSSGDEPKLAMGVGIRSGT